VSNTRRDIKYKFTVINLVKPDSSYNQGQKPLFYSMKDSSKVGSYGWYRDGENIAYYQNAMKKKGGGNYYSLQFEVQFKHDDDEVYIAHCYPYTYTDCCNLLERLCTSQNKDKIRKTVLTKTIAGNNCEMVIITNFNSRPELIALRRAVILTSRVHPGESNASFMMEGTLQYLISDDDGARYLRDNFVFKIIPMLNPDGVIIGNYRCSLSGLDLNRQWITPSQKICPELHATKVMMRKTQDSRDIKNLFMYGCSN
jgi:murein tripeptide amidase MpaA